MSAIKVMHFISGIRSGGVEQMLINYTTILNKYEYKQIIVYQHTPDKVCLDKLEHAGNKCVRISSKSRHPLGNITETIKLIKKVHPDIVHAHMNLVNFIPLFCALLCGVKVRISHAHISKDNIRLFFLVPVFKFCCKLFATKLFACGVDAGKYMYGNSEFKVIKNAVDTKSFLVDRKDVGKLQADLKLPDGSVVVGHIGRFVKQKNHKRLLQIFNRFHKTVPNSYLILIGTGELVKSIKKDVFNMGLIDYVYFIGSVSDTAKYYSLFDLFILPSLYEGLPVVAIESQSAGTPSLFADTIDSDVDLLSTTRLISLNKSDSEWVLEMQKLIKKSRLEEKSVLQIMNNAGFNIITAVSILNYEYQKSLRRSV